MWIGVNYEQWHDTCDTLHAHTQVLGKLAATLAPPEPQLQHAALRLTARGWETLPLPAPDRSGSLVVVLDLRIHEAVVEHSGGRTARVPLTPHRPVGAVTRDVLAAVRDLGGPVRIDPTPQEVPWQVPLDADDEHAHYDPEQVAGLLRRGDHGRAGAGGLPGAVPRALHPGQRLVGILRPGGQPVLRPAGRTARRRTSSCATRWTRRRSRWAGGRATGATAGPRSTRTRTRPRPASTARIFLARRALGRRAGGVHPGLGRRPRRG